MPSCSTIYLDKPMRNQALMQTITRANRVFPGKNNGLIVGYVDVLSNLHKALAIYASTGALGQTVLPVEEKDALVDALRDAVDEIRRFCQARDVDLDHITTLRQFEWVEALKDVSDQLMLSDEETSSFLERATRVERLFKAILPDDRANEFAPIRKVIRVVMDRIGEAGGRPEVSGVMAQIEQLLDESVAANAYLIGSEERKSLMDLSEVDWDNVKAMFASGRQRTAAQKLRSMLTARITNLTRLNPTRVDLLRALSAAPRAVQRRQPERSAVLRRARQAQPLADRGGGAGGLGRGSPRSSSPSSTSSLGRGPTSRRRGSSR